MPIYHYTVPPELEGKPLRTAALRGLGMSEGLYKQFKFHGSITRNGEPFARDYRVFAGDRLEFSLKEAARQDPPAPSAQGLKVAWGDESFLIVDKPAPLPSAPGKDPQGETLANRVFTWLGEPEAFVYRPVNRLDKGTSGLMVVARDARTQDRLSRLLHTPDFLREYLAVCEGIPNPGEGIIRAPIAKADCASVKRIVSPEGREAVTHYRLIGQGRGRSLVRLRLETGRTHQIRVHMANLGCPVCGDFLYGSELPQLPGRFALHSCQLTLLHPYTGERLLVESPLPRELEKLLE